MGNGNGKKNGNGNGSAFKALSEQRRAFVLNYIKYKRNGTRAYLEAYDPNGKKGMKDATAAAAATRLLNDVKVMAAIIEKISDPLREMELDVDKVLRAMAVTGLAPISTWCEWNEHGQLTLKLPEELPPEFWLPVKKIKTKHIRTPTGAVKVDQEFEISRSNPMLEVLADMFKLIPPRKIGVGLSRDAAGDTPGGQKLPGEHGFPPIPQTIAEWEEQVRQSNVARELSEHDDEG